MHLGVIVWLGKGWAPSAPLGRPVCQAAAREMVFLLVLVLCIVAFAHYDRGLVVGLSRQHRHGEEAVKVLQTTT